ncbi:MAG: aldehyde dehydrogenase (NADP(+)) [Verrucomicrobiales bacterium]|nr:aldehyde dehydrogenase (NADP(+)) [Verrucomicrobiales bacterium]
MTLTGKQLIGYSESADSKTTFQGMNPATGKPLEPPFHEATETEIDRAVTIADEVFGTFRDLLAERRADFLEAIVEETLALGDEFLELASAETGHPLARCAMERDRALNQARLFEELLREGSWVDARIDLGDPARQPVPKPDVRSLLQPVGPVAVFGASNFPIAISVLGADTISAFAAGCPVIVKAHPAHPGTCEMASRAIVQAAERMNMPEGVFSLVQGKGIEVGTALVQHPKLMAAAFTGSLKGGRALMDVAAARPVPIPFYAEMGSVNPIFILPGALKENPEEIAGGFVNALTLGVGQFCTNPGLALGIQSDQWDEFSQLVSERVSQYPPSTMLHEGIHAAYVEGIIERSENEDLLLLGESDAEANPAACEAAAYVFETTQQGLLNDPTLLEELFGPVSTLVSCAGLDDMVAIAEKLDGSLSVTVHGTEEDLIQFKPLLKVLQRKAGRLIFNGYPVGIEVCHSMHHGGPYPAASHSFFTSIGTRCIQRFVRPVCYQNWPNSQLPLALQNENPRGVWRMIDGVRTRDEV